MRAKLMRRRFRTSWRAFAGCTPWRQLSVGTPVQVVEPVVDSSRYYVLRIEDRASRRHAFIGMGFRCLLLRPPPPPPQHTNLPSPWHCRRPTEGAEMPSASAQTHTISNSAGGEGVALC